MNIGHPAQSLALALDDALRNRLLGVPSELATALYGPLGGTSRTRRPTEQECQVTMFQQCWRLADAGFRRIEGDTSVDGSTIIITGPMGDACVYCCAQFAYHVRQPNRRFFLDAAGQHMAGVGGCLGYEEAVTHGDAQLDYSVEMELSRWQAMLAHTSDAQRAVLCKRLHAFADGLVQASRAVAAAEPAAA